MAGRIQHKFDASAPNLDSTIQKGKVNRRMLLAQYGGFKKSSCSPEGKPAQNPKHCELKGFGQQKQSLPGRVFQELADKPDADRLLRRPARAGQTKLKPQFQSRLGVTVAGSPVG